mgnify:CR=1 FL=1
MTIKKTFIVEPKSVLTKEELERIGITIFDNIPDRDEIIEVLMEDYEYMEGTLIDVGEDLELDRLNYAITMLGTLSSPLWALHRSYLSANIINDAYHCVNFYSIILTEDGTETLVESAAYLDGENTPGDIHIYYDNYIEQLEYDQGDSQVKNRH